jgi:hypothetical protein
MGPPPGNAGPDAEVFVALFQRRGLPRAIRYNGSRSPTTAARTHQA